jgi:hypothetical protein
VRRVACLALLAGGSVLAGCGGGDDQEAPQRAAQAHSTSTATQPPSATAPVHPRSQGKLPPPKPARRANPAATRVIEAWSTALRRGRVDAAASYFALPSLVENGTPPLRVRTRSDARAFNASLPCGAVLRRAVAIGRFTVVVFRLTQRPGGDCGTGVGHAAGTAFVIRRGKIVEWRRVDERDVPPIGVVPSTGKNPPEAPVLPPGKRPQQQVPTATGPVI